MTKQTGLSQTQDEVDVTRIEVNRRIMKVLAKVIISLVVVATVWY